MDWPIKLRSAFLLTTLACASGDAEAQPARLEAGELRRFKAVEAHQGVAVDDAHVYAITNRSIGKYDKNSGKRVDRWSAQNGKAFVHLNSCKVIGEELRCAHSNSPHLPMASSVEYFDTASMEHVRSVSLGLLPGGATFIADRGDSHWLLLANYDTRSPKRGTDFTQLVELDEDWRRKGGWALPDSVLDRMRPHSASGGAWGPDGLLYVTGHDRKEMYVLQIPSAGAVLRHVATIAIPAAGQAFAFDHSADDRVVYGLIRASREIVAFRLPTIAR